MSFDDLSSWVPLILVFLLSSVLFKGSFLKGFKGGGDGKRMNRYETDNSISEVRWRGRSRSLSSAKRKRSQSAHRGRTIEFLYRIKGSCRVKLSPNIRFSNPRGPHVSTDVDVEELIGKRFYLGKRTVSEVEVRGNVVVMYQIIGVRRRKEKTELAHLTVYFGPAHGSEYY
jgi:hypothetical protein